MKTSRLFRIFMMALDTVVLILLRPFVRFTRLFTFKSKEGYTDPEKLGIKPELEVDGIATEKYERKDKIWVEPDEKYSEHDGIVTFRSDNLRSGDAYGTADLKEKKLEVVWSVETGKLKKSYGSGWWTGSGWTGQPLIVNWTKEQKEKMNMFPAAKNKDGLKEVIYSTMDGKVYFIDAETGEKTREELSFGMPFKGAGAIDPRFPILYLGPGDAGPEKYARSVVCSLEDGSTMFEFGGQDPFAPRVFCGFDSSHLVDKKTDTLIEPSENGIIYTFKLNTQTGEDGKVTVNPTERVKLRYTTARSGEDKYWLGMEDSSILYHDRLYIADNGGNLLCININTMEVIWAQDVKDDTNGSPVFSIEDGVPYIYIATSLHWTASKLLKLGRVPIFKINADTGEYVWIREYLCNTVAGISGGIQATCALGKHSVNNLVFFPVARTPQVRSGIMAALDKKTGEVVWKYKMKRYAWSSPVLVYNKDGEAVLITADSVGNLIMLDAKTGKELSRVFLGANIEATPAVYGDMLVVGTRGMKIFGVKIK